jgi:hypothetical protein
MEKERNKRGKENKYLTSSTLLIKTWNLLVHCISNISDTSEAYFL